MGGPRCSRTWLRAGHEVYASAGQVRASGNLDGGGRLCLQEVTTWLRAFRSRDEIRALVKVELVGKTFGTNKSGRLRNGCDYATVISVTSSADYNVAGLHVLSGSYPDVRR